MTGSAAYYGYLESPNAIDGVADMVYADARPVSDLEPTRGMNREPLTLSLSL